MGFPVAKALRWVGIVAAVGVGVAVVRPYLAWQRDRHTEAEIANMLASRRRPPPDQ